VNKDTPLSEWLSKSGRSQNELAKSVNLTQGAISKMLRTKRNVFVRELQDGCLELVEIKPIAKNDSPENGQAA